MADPAPVYILGNLPPPVGGVSTFVRRYVALMRARGNHPEVRDWVKMGVISRTAWLLKLLFDPTPLRLELNAYETWSMAALIVRLFPSHILLRVHSGRPETNLPRSRRWLFRRFLKEVDEFVLVGPHVRGVLAEGGFHVPEDARIEPAFLPPPEAEESAILSTYSASERAFVESHEPLLVMQGADGFHQGIDLYGTDLVLTVLPRLVQLFPDLGLVIGRPTRGDERFQAYCAQLDRQMQESGLLQNILLIEGERELWPILKRGDLFLRPTALDGDSISVREALYFGVPVVASDPVPRPDGVHLFSSRDAEDMLRCILEVLQASPSEHPSSPEAPCS